MSKCSKRKKLEKKKPKKVRFECSKCGVRSKKKDEVCKPEKLPR